jgi:alkaline phosphatase
MKKLFFPFLVLFCTYFAVQAQYSTLQAHSHNDYEQKLPFFEAYNAHFGSIEADIWEVNGELFVAHDKNRITPEKTLDALYIQPIVMKFKANGGKAWNDHPGTFQLLIDLKSPYETTLHLLAEKLKKYPDVFDPAVNKNAVKVVISGNRPNPEQFVNYPEFIFFDGLLTLKYDGQQIKRIALFSDNLANHTLWKGVGPVPENELLKLKQVIGSVHNQNLKIRFWNAPDTPQAWQTFQNLKVDFINTDHIQQLKEFLTIK